MLARVVNMFKVKLDRQISTLVDRRESCANEETPLLADPIEIVDVGCYLLLKCLSFTRVIPPRNGN